MKIGDGSKPFSLFGGSQAKAGQKVERTLESLVGAAGNALREDTARTADRFEKATAPAYQALLGSATTAGGAMADAGAVLLGGLRSQLGRAESDTRALMRRIDDLSAAGAAGDGTPQGAGDLGTALLDGLAAASDALARAQEITAAESTLESLIGHAGRLLRADTARDVEGLGRALDGLKSAADHGKATFDSGLTVAEWTVQKQAAEGLGVGELKQELTRVENQLRLILRQIEEVRSAEAGEQEAAESDAGDDPLAAVAESVSDARAAISDLFT